MSASYARLLVLYEDNGEISLIVSNATDTFRRVGFLLLRLRDEFPASEREGVSARMLVASVKRSFRDKTRIRLFI